MAGTKVKLQVHAIDEINTKVKHDTLGRYFEAIRQYSLNKNRYSAYVGTQVRARCFNRLQKFAFSSDTIGSVDSAAIKFQEMKTKKIPLRVLDLVHEQIPRIAKEMPLCAVIFCRETRVCMVILSYPSQDDSFEHEHRIAMLFSYKHGDAADIPADAPAIKDVRYISIPGDQLCQEAQMKKNYALGNLVETFVEYQSHVYFPELLGQMAAVIAPTAGSLPLDSGSQLQSRVAGDFKEIKRFIKKDILFNSYDTGLEPPAPSGVEY
jgi:hypothetical protein